MVTDSRRPDPASCHFAPCSRSEWQHKIFDRYKDCGVPGVPDRSRRPYRQANRLPPQLEAVIVRLKREYPGWGAPKIREKLRRQSAAPHLPAISTVHAIATAWCTGAGGGATQRLAPRSRAQPNRTRSGALTTKASSCSAIGGTAIR